MNRLIALFLTCIVAVSLFAQTADIEVSYEAHRPDFSDGVTDVTNQYILLANGRESKFFSPKTQYIDSLNSTPEGKAKIAEMTKTALAAGRFDDIPGPDGTMYVVKSFELGKLRHYDTSGLEKLVYEEPVCAMEWQVCDSTKTVLGYECVKATADYHGRKWTVWFAPEIPVQDGPWKFAALPGLILEAAAEGAQYSFIATGIQQSQKPIGEVPLSEDYEKVKRIDYLKSKRAFMDNPLGKINAQYGSTGVTISASDGADLEQLFVPASVADFLETDYH